MDVYISISTIRNFLFMQTNTTKQYLHFTKLIILSTLFMIDMKFC